MTEKAITFNCDGSELLGIVNAASGSNKIAVLIVVGGPQYRVGSHRQFVQLARALAKAGVSSMRFDYRGLGDSEGDKRSFDSICDDIGAACDAMCATLQCEKIVLWGLCDAASAALLYTRQDPRICGLILLNPWLRNEQAMAKSMVKFYYLQRLLSLGFWKKLFKGKVNISNSLKDASNNVTSTMQTQSNDEQSYQARMLAGAQQFSGPVCLILSGNDLTAREFLEQTQSESAWKRFVKEKCQIFNLPNADHTFSNRDFKAKVDHISAQFVLSI